MRINYKHMYNFDLMCLYGNSESIRAGLYRDHGLSFRLDPQLNKILTRDSSGRLGLQPGISKLIPTVHALVYAVDATRSDGGDLEVMRQELSVLLESQEKFNTPTPLLVTSHVTGVSVLSLVSPCRFSPATLWTGPRCGGWRTWSAAWALAGWTDPGPCTRSAVTT